MRKVLSAVSDFFSRSLRREEQEPISLVIKSGLISRICYSLPLLCAALFFTVTAVAEQRELKTEDSIEKLDAILLLDASGSMLTTDPTRLRDEGAKLFTQFLKPGDRLGILEFSEVVKTIRPLTEYDRAQTDEISRQLAGVGSSGTYTDLLGAIKSAHSELKSHLREDARQIIVLLSDGKMDPDPARATTSANSAELVNTELPALKADGIKVHTLYFSDQADKDLLAEIALGSDGVNWFTPSADKIHESYADLFLVVKKPQIVPMAGKAFQIDEDIDEATFYINREEGATVTLEGPDKSVFNAASDKENLKWYTGTKFDVITVEKPTPGKWRITGLANADGFATVLTDLKLITEWPSSFNAKDPVLLQARLYEEKKPVTLPQMTGVVKYGFQIIPTDKVSEPILRSFLVDDGSVGDKIADDGIYSQKISIDEPGEYKLTIVAKAPTFTRHQQIPFRVKPRLISLRVVAGSEDHGHEAAGAHGDEHGKEGEGADHEDAHPEHSATEQGHEEGHQDESHDAPGVIKGTIKDVFEIVLSAEASALRNTEVKLTATDSNRRRFTVPVTKAPGRAETVTYQAPATILPGSGGFQLQASLTGVTSKKEHIHAESEELQYLKAVNQAAVEDVTEVLIVEKPVEEERFPLTGLAIISITNLLCAVGIIFYLKKIIAGGSFELPEMPPLEPVRLALAGMQEKLNLTTLDLNDPRFAGASDEAGSVDLSASPSAKAIAPEPGQAEESPAVEAGE